MDMEAGKTLTNEEVIRELLDLLKKNAMKEQANDVFEICSYVDFDGVFKNLPCVHGVNIVKKDDS